jgi:hypothetical protein
MRSFSRVLGAAALVVSMTTTGLSYAGDTSTAEYLFQQGLDAMKRNQFKEACDAFGGSNEADPSPGTQINLALCNEKQNKLASAWGWYRTAAGLADQRGQKERAELARAEATKLEPKLHKLTISVKFPAEGMTVTRNGAPVPTAVLGTDVPIDPGDYNIEVSAKRKKAWKQAVHIDAAPGVSRVEVPALEDGPPEPVGPGGDSKPVTGGNEGSTQRTVGFVLGGAGILALVTAGGIQIFNLAVTNRDYKDRSDQLDASRLNGDCKNAPKGDNCMNLESAVQSKDDARKGNQLASLIVGAAGGAMLVAGIVLLVAAPSAKTGSLSRPLVLPMVTRDTTGLGLSASF